MGKNSAIHSSIFELQQLVAQHNHTGAFEKLYLHFYKDLHQFAYSIIKSNHIAEEIVSDVFVQVWKNRQTLAEIRQLRVFLYVAVKNQALTYLYKQKRQAVCWIEEFAHTVNSLEDRDRADDRLREKELSWQIRRAVNGLPAKCRAVFILVKEDGLKYAEVAKLLNLSLKTIENQMGIALKKVAHHLRTYSVRDR